MECHLRWCRWSVDRVSIKGFDQEYYILTLDHGWRPFLTRDLKRIPKRLMLFSTDAASHDLNSSTPLCYKCGLRNFQELAYQFRRDIPREQLPGLLKFSFSIFCFWKCKLVGNDKSDYSDPFAVY